MRSTSGSPTPLPPVIYRPFLARFFTISAASSQFSEETAVVSGVGVGDSLMAAAGRDDLGEDPRLADNAGRVAHEKEIDAAIEQWTRGQSSQEVLAALEAASVPSGPILSVQDMASDPQYQARGMFERVAVPQSVKADGQLAIPAIPPRLNRTPGATEWAGPELGAHNEEVFGGLLGLSEAEIKGLERQSII